MPKTEVGRDRELMRLDSMARHLRLKRRYPTEGFVEEAVAACLRRVEPIVREVLPCRGEVIADALAEHYGVTFEEVRDAEDVDLLEDKYLKQRGELGFARLRKELKDPHVDALLFRRMHASVGDADEYVAVLNLQDSDAKLYWNKKHELTHRIAEPQQRLLPFRRHRFERSNPLESVIDGIAGELAYYPPVFQPLVRAAAKQKAQLTFDVIRKLRMEFAPTSSLLATTNAVVKHWPRPAMAIVASLCGRKNNPAKDRALRASLQARNELARTNDLLVFPNMRVPRSSPIYAAHTGRRDYSGRENLGQWTTSTGDALPTINAYTSAQYAGGHIYAVLSLA